MKLTRMHDFCVRRKVHRSTVYRQLAAGVLKGKKLGRITYIIDDDEALPDYKPLSQREPSKAA